MVEREIKTGTTTVALVCKDGIILAADKRATSGNLISHKKFEKIIKITDKIAVTVAGTVSDVQLLTKLVRAELKLKDIRTDRESNVREAANLLASMVYNNIRKLSLIPGISHFLVGGSDPSGIYLFDLAPDGSIVEVDDFVSSGSGSVMAYGVLETLYKKGISVDEGVKLAVKCINAAILRDSASGNGIDVFTITQEGIKKTMTQEIKYGLED
ncbi:proteasome subunit beta [Candidatus Woesearchaeota archaeon]|nr:proteasome subunit beta [Candidatus Woesearchaeota archaeon]